MEEVVKIPAGWVIVRGDRFPEIIAPLWPILQQIPKSAVGLDADPSAQPELDATIDRVRVSGGNMELLTEMSDNALALLLWKFSELAARAAQAEIDNKPFMLAPPDRSDAGLLIDLIRTEIRSPEVHH